MKALLGVFLLSASLVFLPMQASAQDPAVENPQPETEQTTEQTTQADENTEEVQSPVDAVLEAFLVQVTESADGTRVENLVPADVATPGDVIEYVVTYENVSESDVVGVIFNAPIPANTTYIDGSAAVSAEAAFEVLITDEDWQSLPAYKTVVDESGNETRVEATASDYIELRWRINTNMAPETSIRTSYRVSIDN